MLVRNSQAQRSCENPAQHSHAKRHQPNGMAAIVGPSDSRPTPTQADLHGMSEDLRDSVSPSESKACGVASSVSTTIGPRGNAEELREILPEILPEILLEIRALVDATGHPCMMVNPEIVERLAQERLRAREESRIESPQQTSNAREISMRRSA